MEQLTEVQKTKRGRYSIFMDGAFYGVLHGDVYAKFPYKVGDSIEPDELEEWIEKSAYIIAKERALSLLSARSYSTEQLRQKLLRDAPPEMVDKVLNRMKELDLLDDKDYAKRYAHDCVHLKGYSHRRTYLALLERRIPTDIAKQTIANLGEEASERLIYQWIKKRYLSKLTTEDGKRKTIAALMRKGFDYYDIAAVVSHLEEDLNYYEE